MSSGFVANEGQLPPAVRYEVDLGSGLVQLFDDGYRLNLPTVQWETPDPTKPRANRPTVSKRGDPHDVRVTFVGSNHTPQLVARDRLTATLSDFRGTDQSKWRRDLSQYASVSYHDLYPTVMLDYTLDATGGFKSTYVVAPHGDPTQIRWWYHGVQDVSVAPDESLVLILPPRAGFATRTLTESAPLAWQDVNGDRVFIPVRFQLSHGKQVSFSVGQYDPSLPLVIDPTLTITRRFGSLLSDVYGDLPTLATHPSGTWFVAGCGASGATMLELASNGATTTRSWVVGTSSECGHVTVTQQGLIVLGVDGATSVRAYTFAIPTSQPQVFTIPSTNGQPTIVDIVPHPTLNEITVLWVDQNLSASNDPEYRTAVTATGVSASVVIATEPTIYHEGRYSATGILYGWFSQQTAQTVVSGVSQWTGASWQVLWQTQHNYSSGWQVRAITTDAQGRVIVMLNELLPPLSGGPARTQRLHIMILTAAGTPVIQRVLTSEPLATDFNDAYRGTTPEAVLVLDDGQILVTGMTTSEAFPAPAVQSGVRGGFALVLDSDGTVVEGQVQYEAGAEETHLNALVQAASSDVLIRGLTWNGSTTASFVASLNTGSQPEDIRPPRYTNSYYEYTKDPTIFYNQGCRSRENQEQGIVFLFFGYPSATGASGYGSNPTYAELKTLTRSFVKGYITGKNCYKSASSPNGRTVSTASPANLTIALSVNNSYLSCQATDANDTCIDGEANPDLTSTNGQQWAVLVAQLQYEINQTYDGVTIVAGLDAEPNWDAISHPGATTRWIEGYGSFANSAPVPLLYLFGSCEDCPRKGYPTTTLSAGQKQALQLVYDWNFKQRYTRSVPQIYNIYYASEWYQVRKYALDRGNTRQIAGIMTQCGSSGCRFPYDNPYWETYDPCPTLWDNLEPDAGWSAMNDKLNRTLKIGLTLSSNFQLPRLYRPMPGLSVTIPNQGAFDMCTTIAPQLLPINTRFEAGNTFIYRYNPAPVYTRETAQSLSWSTDIFGYGGKTLAPFR